MKKEQKLILEDFFERQTLQVADGVELLSCLAQLPKLGANFGENSEKDINQLLNRIDSLNIQDNGQLALERLLQLVINLKNASE